MCHNDGCVCVCVYNSLLFLYIILCLNEEKIYGIVLLKCLKLRLKVCVLFEKSRN